MKSPLLYLTLFSCILAGCRDTETSKNFDTEIVIAIDQTDPLTVLPDINEIVSLSGIENNIWSGVMVTVTTITDKDINPIIRLPLNGKNRLWNNMDRREREVKSWRDSLTKVLEKFTPDENASLSKSVIYRSLCSQLNQLSKTPSRHRFLIVYSNLMENSSINFISPNSIKRITNDREALKTEFHKECSLPNLTGISIYFVHEPKDYADNVRYMSVSGFFAELFTGANVILAGENIN